MQAGKLDRVIIIERLTRTIDDAGTPIEAWATLATLRAQLITTSTTEYLRSFGESAEQAVIFRTHWFDGLTVQDRITYQETAYNLREIKELGRRRGLELRCEKVGT